MNKLKLVNDKRGVGLGDLYPAVLAIVLVGIIIGIGIFILSATSDAISNTETTISNETIAAAVDPGTAVSRADDCGADNFAVTQVLNETEYAIIPATNYTFDDLGNLVFVASSEWIGYDVNVTYTYDGGDTSTTGYCGAMSTAATGIGGFASWIAVIVVVLAAAIVLGIVLNSFGNRGNGV